MIDLARRIGVPVRHFHDQVRYSGLFYGQTGKGESFPAGISVDHLGTVLAGLEPGTTELGCHPGDGDDVESMYRTERAIELRTLCDPQVRQALTEGDIHLGSFHAIRG